MRKISYFRLTLKRGRVGQDGAFTLVELLAVIAIVAILSALLFSISRKIIESGKAAVCTSNLRQIGNGLQQYAADNNGMTPPVFSTTGMPWNFALVAGNYINVDPSKVSSVFQCPTQQANPLDYGTGYGMRQPIDPESWRGWRIGSGGVSAEAGGDLNRFSSLSSFLMVADTVRSEGYQWYYFDTRAGSTERIHARHAKKANCLFGDGHVEALSRNDLAGHYGNASGQWPIDSSAVSEEPPSR